MSFHADVAQCSGIQVGLTQGIFCLVYEVNNGNCAMRISANDYFLFHNVLPIHTRNDSDEDPKTKSGFLFFAYSVSKSGRRLRQGGDAVRLIFAKLRFEPKVKVASQILVKLVICKTIVAFVDSVPQHHGFWWYRR